MFCPTCGAPVTSEEGECTSCAEGLSAGGRSTTQAKLVLVSLPSLVRVAEQDDRRREGPAAALQGRLCPVLHRSLRPPLPDPLLLWEAAAPMGRRLGSGSPAAGAFVAGQEGASEGQGHALGPARSLWPNTRPSALEHIGHLSLCRSTFTH